LKRITLQLRPDQYERLKVLTRPGTSIAALVRQALDEYLAQDLPKNSFDVK